MSSFSEEFFNNRWDQSNIPMRMRGFGLDSYVPVNASNSDSPHNQTLKSVAIAKEFVNNFVDKHYLSSVRAKAGKYPEDRSKLGKGLLLCGPNGTRKSTLAAAVATDVQYLSPSLRVYYIRFKDWKDCLTTTFSKEVTKETILAGNRLTIARTVPLLVLDDVGQEHRTQSGFTEKELHELLRIRYESSKPTVITTNITPGSFENVYGTSFESFAHDAFYTLKMYGQDSRKG
jgi:DNA replication protein DnaC